MINKYSGWSPDMISAQLRSQAKSTLDPDLERFFVAAAEKIDELHYDYMRIHNDLMNVKWGVNILSAKQTEDYERVVLASIDWHDYNKACILSKSYVEWKGNSDALHIAEITLASAIEKLRGTP